MVEILFIVMQAWLYCKVSTLSREAGSVPHCTFIVQLLTSLVYSKLSQSQRCVVTHKTMWQSRYCELAALFTQNNEQLSSVNLGHGFTLIKTKIRVFSIKKWWACLFQVMCTTREPSSYAHKAVYMQILGEFVTTSKTMVLPCYTSIDHTILLTNKNRF